MPFPERLDRGGQSGRSGHRVLTQAMPRCVGRKLTCFVVDRLRWQPCRRCPSAPICRPSGLEGSPASRSTPSRSTSASIHALPATREDGAMPVALRQDTRMGFRTLRFQPRGDDPRLVLQADDAGGAIYRYETQFRDRSDRSGVETRSRSASFRPSSGGRACSFVVATMIGIPAREAVEFRLEQPVAVRSDTPPFAVALCIPEFPVATPTSASNSGGVISLPSPSTSPNLSPAFFDVGRSWDAATSCRKSDRRLEGCNGGAIAP